MNSVSSVNINNNYQINSNKNMPSFKALTPREKQILFVNSGLQGYLKNINENQVNPKAIFKFLQKALGAKNIQELPFLPDVSRGVTKGRKFLGTIRETGKKIIFETHTSRRGIETRLHDTSERVGKHFRTLSKENRDYLTFENGAWDFKTNHYKSENAHLKSNKNGNSWIDASPLI